MHFPCLSKATRFVAYGLQQELSLVVDMVHLHSVSRPFDIVNPLENLIRPAG